MKRSFELLIRTHAKIFELKKPLESIIRDNESRFVKLGEDLQAVYGDVEQLKIQTVKTAGLIGEGAEGTLLSEITIYTKDSMEDLESIRNNVSAILPGFESCLTNINRLHKICPEILKIASTLNIVALNISVESSRTKISEEMFDIFVKEIRELAKRVNDIAYRIKEDSEVSLSGSENDFSDIHAHMNRLDNMADAVSDMVSENVMRINKVMNLTLHALKESETRSQRISTLVGEVVMAIQFHDIVRQQVEHVIDAFQDLEASIREKDMQTACEEDILGILGEAFSLLHLQTRQLKQILSEITDAHIKITTSFNEIGKETTGLVGDVDRLGSGNIKVNDQEGVLEMLISGFKKLEIIMSDGEKLWERIDEAMNLTSVSASNISGYLSAMQEIGMDLHIKSVNALLMSKRLGARGIALSVLAQYVTDISKGSDHFVNDVIDILKKMQEASRELQSRSFHNDGSKTQAGIHASEKVSRITAIYELFKRETGDSFRDCIKLKEKISGVESRLVFMDRMKSQIEECLQKMDAIFKDLAPFVDNEKYLSDLNRLKSRYTMEIERDIHQRSLKNSGDVLEDAGKHMDFNELGDNIELF